MSAVDELYKADGVIPVTVQSVQELGDEVKRLRGGGWRPIETAPKDGTEILVALCGGEWATSLMVVSYDADQPDFPWITLDGGQGYHKDAPTHWMPLPPPPIYQRQEHDSPSYQDGAQRG